MLLVGNLKVTKNVEMLRDKITNSKLRQFLILRKKLWGALSLSIINQILTSGTNFGIGIYLLHTLSADQFGLYGIGFACVLFVFGVGHFAVLTPMAVRFQEKPQENRLHYAACMLSIVLLFSFVVFATTLIGVFILWMVCSNRSPYTGYVTAIAFSSGAYLVKEFYIRHAYNISRETLAITVHAVIAFATFLLFLIKGNMGGNFSADDALWIYGASQVSGVIVAYRMSPMHFLSVSRVELVSEFRKMWPDCKWGSIIGVIYFVRAQSHTIIVTALIGPIGVAKLNASRMLITPMAMLTPALSQVALPRLAANRINGDKGVIRVGFAISTSLLILTVVYSSIILSAYDFISIRVLGVMYGDVFFITVFWCLYLCVVAFRNGVEMSAQTLCKVKNLSKINAVSAAAGLASTYWLTSTYGLVGSLLGLSVAEILMAIMLYLSLRGADLSCKTKGCK